MYLSKICLFHYQYKTKSVYTVFIFTYYKKIKKYIASNNARSCFIHYWFRKLNFNNCTIASIVLESVVEKDNLSVLNVLSGSFSAAGQSKLINFVYSYLILLILFYTKD